MKFDYDKVKEATKLLLEGIGDDPNRDGLKDTPDRIAKAYQEVMGGYDLKAEDVITEFDNDENYTGPVVLKNAELYSFCEHHQFPFLGEVSIAYQPGDKILGLSKLLRVARVHAKRLQVQERLTKGIADDLNRLLSPEWVAVRYEAEHFCMRIRGTRVKDSTTITLYGHGNWPQNIFNI